MTRSPLELHDHVEPRAPPSPDGWAIWHLARSAMLAKRGLREREPHPAAAPVCAARPSVELMFWPRREKGASGASSSETTRRSRQPHASARWAGGEHQRKQANGAKEQGWADMHMRARVCAGKWQPLSGHKNPVGKSRIIGPRRADVRGGQTRGAAGSAQLGPMPS